MKKTKYDIRHGSHLIKSLLMSLMNEVTDPR